MDPALRYAAEFQIPSILDLIAIILLAITGALSAAKRGYDWIGAMSIALVTGCGGGLIRDILLNVRPVFLEHGAYIWAVFAAVLLSIYFFPLVSRMHWIFLVADALGLAMYAVIGTQKSLNTGLGISAAILIGTLNAIGGGLIRDIFTREEASLLKPGAVVRGDCARGKCALLSPESSLARVPHRRRDCRRSRRLHRETSRAPLRSSDPGGKARGVRYASFVNNRCPACRMKAA
jgi:uncharacterized membrane protein YeiH